jgi:hypothetical protein
MKKKEFSPLTQAISSLPIIHKTNDFPHPLNDSPPIEGVCIHQGYKCNHCNDMLTVNEAHMRKHISNKHRSEHTLSNPGYRPASLQAWIHQGKYCTVVDPNSSFEPSAPCDPANLDPSDGSIPWEERFARIEALRLEQQENNPLSTSARDRKDDTTPWLL